MSDPVSALGGRSFDGSVQVLEAGLHGMITLRGDQGSAALQKAVRDLTGVAVPAQRRIEASADKAVAWMSPDELLILCPYAEAPAAVDKLTEALSGIHAMAMNVSDARAMFRLTGHGIREVIARLAPVDMSADAFRPGDFRRTRFAQVAGAMWMTDTTTAQVICFRSVATYMMGLLCNAAQPGAEVGFIR